MKNIYFLILFTLGIYAQAQQDTINLIVQKVVDQINTLPKSNITGKGDFVFQHKYVAQWVDSNQSIILYDKRYKPNSSYLLGDEHITIIKLQSLHTSGVLVRSTMNDKNISLQLFTANNMLNIKSLTYMKGEYRFGMFFDRTTIGYWDSSLVKEQLNNIQSNLIDAINILSNWDVADSPDLEKTIKPEVIKTRGVKYSSIKYEQNEESPLFARSSLDVPALFLDAKDDDETDIRVNEYLLKQLKQRGIKFKGRFSGSIVISETGTIEDFKSFKNNSKKVEQVLTQIILDMPDWKAGTKDGKSVRSTYLVYLKK